MYFCGDDVGHLALQLPAVVGEGELLKGPFAVQEPVYGVLEGPLSPSAPGCPLLSSLGSLPVSLLQVLMLSHFSLAAFRVHLPAPLP